jgi:hypothetical protein
MDVTGVKQSSRPMIYTGIKGKFIRLMAALLIPGTGTGTYFK